MGQIMATLKDPNVGLLLYSYILVLLTLMHLQPPLSISNDDTYYTMIGTFLLSVFAISNIRHSNNSHSGVYLPFVCLIFSAKP